MEGGGGGISFNLDFGQQTRVPDFAGAYGQLAATTQALSRIIAASAQQAGEQRQR